MKHSFKQTPTSRFAALLMIAGALFVGACDSDLTGIPGARLEVSDDSLTLTSIGATAQLSAVLVLPDGGNASAVVRWRSNDPAVARIDATGKVTAAAPGSAIISADAGGANAQTHVFVQQVAARIEIGAYPASIAVPDSFRFAVAVFDSLGQSIAAPALRWTSNAEWAPVDSTGMMRVRGAASIQVIATSGTAADTANITSTVRFAAVAAGNAHACGLSTDGDPYCWGYIGSGALGEGVTAGPPGPFLAHASGGVIRFRQVTAGRSHTCGVGVDDRAYCAGAGLGIGTGPIVSKHIEPVNSTIAFQGISAGSEHTCAIAKDGSAHCWGSARRGEIGRDTFVIHFPRKVETPTTFIAIAAGGRHTCAIGTDQFAYCWGSNEFGQLGRGSVDTLSHPTPQRVAGEQRFASISSGNAHTCGIAIDASIFCWGDNRLAQLTNTAAAGMCETLHGSQQCATTPVRVNAPASATRITAGRDHTCAIAGGALWCWGSNAFGKAGAGTAVIAAAPTQVPGSWSAVAAGSDFTCGIREQRLVCWGDNAYGQLGTGEVGTGSLQPQPIRFQP